MRVFQRPFDNHAAQWNHAITQTGIATPWVLALDADYVATPAFVAELARCDLDGATAGYRCRFVYCVEGTPLRGALYPPVIALFRRVGARYVQDGHTQRLHIDGPVGAIASPLLHDDRKPLDRWIGAQARYARLEAAKLAATPWRELPFSGRVRRLIVVAPVLVPLHCLIVKGGILHGRAGVYYALQRGVAETLIALNLLARALRPERASVSLVLGINAFHGDAAAASCATACWSPPPRRSASAASSTGPAFPREAIGYCLPKRASSLADVDHVAVNQDARANLGRKLAYIADAAARPGAGARPPAQQARALGHRRSCWARRSGRGVPAARSTPSSTTSRTSPRRSTSRRSTEAVAVSVDGFGDFASAAWGVGRGDEMSTSTTASTSRTRSASSTRRSRSTSASRTTATSTR